MGTAKAVPYVRTAHRLGAAKAVPYVRTAHRFGAAKAVPYVRTAHRFGAAKAVPYVRTAHRFGTLQQRPTYGLRTDSAPLKRCPTYGLRTDSARYSSARRTHYARAVDSRRRCLRASHVGHPFRGAVREPSDSKSFFQWIRVVDEKRMLAGDPRGPFDLRHDRRILPHCCSGR